ncbi:cytochrome P450 [Crucibulum laeve]|uniref:Cytochrome P450 n=1 Tax=Crucibulum laeve TaxID=68775 RepID=A0A5C3LNU5_9AGAR|nr:cytochrome P450 [Crucibulum laeve]
MHSFDILAFIAASWLAILLCRKRKRELLPLPPGPRKLPIVGNLFDIPIDLGWLVYHQWSRLFLTICVDTDILHLDVAGTSIIVLDRYEAAWELFEKRSSIYSGRPSMPMVTELMGWDFNTGFMQYGAREHRRLLHRAFNPGAIPAFRPHALKATHGLLRRLLDDGGEDVCPDIRQWAGEFSISVAYGLDVKPKNDPYIELAEDGVRSLLLAALPGKFLVNTIPILKYMPEWMPGAGFKRQAKEWRKHARKMLDAPYEAAKRNLRNTGGRASFSVLGLEKLNLTETMSHEEENVQGVAGTLYAGAYGLTPHDHPTLASCILLLMDHPEVFKRAQVEVDSILQPGHLPDFGDMESLPYIMAIIKETMRLRVIVPLVPHMAQAEDEYNGYRIPKDSIVIANAWAMLQDDSTYSDPTSFNPDRFMKDGKLNRAVKDPGHATWGFGRRICPGRYLALETLWIGVASLVATFNLTKAVDKDGNIIEPSHEYESGLVAAPLPFKCSFIPRSNASVDMIRLTSSNNDQ